MTLLGRPHPPNPARVLRTTGTARQLHRREGSPPAIQSLRRSGGVHGGGSRSILAEEARIRSIVRRRAYVDDLPVIDVLAGDRVNAIIICAIAEVRTLVPTCQFAAMRAPIRAAGLPVCRHPASS